MSQHTPGPWTTSEYSSIVGIAVDGPNYKHIAAVIPRSTSPDVECKANANLIAAAPDLLEACRAALYACSCTVLERDSGHRIDCCIPSSLEPAIAKAEGRS